MSWPLTACRGFQVKFIITYYMVMDKSFMRGQGGVEYIVLIGAVFVITILVLYLLVYGFRGHSDTISVRNSQTHIGLLTPIGIPIFTVDQSRSYCCYDNYKWCRCYKLQVINNHLDKRVKLLNIELDGYNISYSSHGWNLWLDPGASVDTYTRALPSSHYCRYGTTKTFESVRIYYNTSSGGPYIETSPVSLKVMCPQ